MGLLIGFILCALTASALTLLLWVPQPVTRLDLLTVGAVSTLIALFVAFLAVSVSVRPRSQHAAARISRQRTS